MCSNLGAPGSEFRRAKDLRLHSLGCERERRTLPLRDLVATNAYLCGYGFMRTIQSQSRQASQCPDSGLAAECCQSSDPGLAAHRCQGSDPGLAADRRKNPDSSLAADQVVSQKYTFVATNVRFCSYKCKPLQARICYQIDKRRLAAATLLVATNPMARAKTKL